jgi:CheY-like chemotaxis protein
LAWPSFQAALDQVLINLVGNAIKFTDVGEVAIKAEANNGAYYVSVQDTGPGISSADQARLFQEFRQADNAITRKKGGTGLGLAISKRIIEMHGGRIWVSVFWSSRISRIGEEALAAIAKQRPDLILMDIQLPIMDGYAATRLIKTDPALRSIPIIAVTSYALAVEEKKARAAGCDDYVTMFSPRQLLAKIRQHMPQ